MNLRLRLPALLALLFGLCLDSLGLLAADVDANRHAGLGQIEPFSPTRVTPRFTTPQWIGEPGVDAVVILSIDDLRATEKYESYLRPVLERLKRIDGRAPFGIFCNASDTTDPRFQRWLKEGVSLEVHTLGHPCPLLSTNGFAAASNNVIGGIDLIGRIPGNHPVAYRMPCCDSMNSASPRFFAELFHQTTPEGRWLSIDSSVMMRFTTNDPALPRALVTEGGEDRFDKYFPAPPLGPGQVSLDAFGGFIEDYPYPYVIGRGCWEFPCAVPSDWEAFNAHGATNSTTLSDWKAALEATVIKQGVMTTILHPHGWSSPQQIVDLVDFAVTRFGTRVKFLTFPEALARIEKNALAGESLRGERGGDNGVRILDVDGDGFLDVVIGNSHRQVTRLWQPTTGTWREVEGPGVLVGPARPLPAVWGIVRDRATTLLLPGTAPGAWEFSAGTWKPAPELMKGAEEFLRGTSGKDAGFRLRDFDHDGRCELLISNPGQNVILAWSAAESRWIPLNYALPDGVAVVDAEGRDNGVRFVDLNDDGFEDVIASNQQGVSIHLWASVVKDYLGWKRGWSHEVRRELRRVPMDPQQIPAFVSGGVNQGAWFHKRHLIVQNEETAPMPDKVWRRPFEALIAFPMPEPRSPEASLASMRVREGFRVDLVAAEPLVAGPVAFDWDASGAMWVVEMRDYPLGLDGQGAPGGVIKKLVDTNGDGLPDSATEFLTGVPFPTGILPWRKGVLVASAPDIFYAEDRNGDGKADFREVLFTGFVPGNQQHRLNGFEWGLDGWIYGANGDSGGKVRSVKTGKVVDISGRDFRFRPDTGEFETVSAGSQFGRRRDDFGEWFGNANPTWLWHVTMPEHYLRRNPALAVKSVRRVLANREDPMRLYPISTPLPRFNQPETFGHVTSANSPTPYRDTLFGPEFERSVFVSDPVYNLVHREVLEPDGATFTSHRAAGEETREFLASTDDWFRPTSMRTGPDGALYIADFYRAVLEHPEWIAPETQSRLDLRAGEDRGRIYRVAPTAAVLRRVPNLSGMSEAGLVAAMDHPNGWQRDTAQRLLFERQATHAAPALRRLALTAGSAKVRVQALCTLDLLNQLSPDTITAALADLHPSVRRQALQLSERFANGKRDRLWEAVESLRTDPEFSVRHQLAYTLGAWKTPAAARVLDQLAEREGDQESMRLAVLSSVSPDSPWMQRWADQPVASRPAARLPAVAAKPSPERARIAASYRGAGSRSGNAERGHELFLQSCAVCHRLKREGNPVGPDLDMVVDKPIDWILTALFDPNAAVEARYQALRVITRGNAEYVGLLVTETANNLTLRMPGNLEQTVLLKDVRERSALGRSLMPEGLEAALELQDVADLLAWLRKR